MIRGFKVAIDGAEWAAELHHFVLTSMLHPGCRTQWDGDVPSMRDPQYFYMPMTART